MSTASLAPGARLGPYEVVSPLGAGGMGEVYRARDTKLGRDVALKVLPDALAADADRLMRFERVIFGQDQRIVESQRPEQVPFDLADELHLKFDAVAVAYRRAMRAQGLARVGTTL